MGSALYNEIEPFACEWLGNLIAGGHIAAGEVDARSIAELDAARLAGVVQAHFFAGIGGWSAALRLAGWPDDRAVWTASCPCQPFSSAGKRGGFDDERHLWPVLFALIRECRPAVLFGEQVASRDGLAWFDAVHADLEGAGYTVGAADLCAAGVGAPHIRQRLWFVADSDSKRRDTVSSVRGHDQQHNAEPRGPVGGVGNTVSTGLERLGGYGDRTTGRTLAPGSIAEAGTVSGTSPTNGLWRDADWLACRDGKWRPVEPGTFPLVDGAAFRMDSGSAFAGKSRVAMLRGAAANGYDQSYSRVQKVSYSHDAMIDLMIAEPRITQTQLAAKFGYSVGWVSGTIPQAQREQRLR